MRQSPPCRDVQITQGRGYALAIVCGALVLSNIACFCCPVWWPPRTLAEVRPEDLAGLYTYEYLGRTVSIYLYADSKFKILNSRRLSGSGTWEVTEGYVVLRYQEPGQWEVKPGWYVTGWRGAYSIIGGEGDPDGWNGLIKVP